jgi:uracil-DNA glycosylase family 4
MTNAAEPPRMDEFLPDPKRKRSIRVTRADEMLGQIVAQEHVTNSVLCHPRANASPPADALKACHARLIDEIRQKRPRKLLALGVKAAMQVTGDRRPISVLRLLASVPSPYFEDDTMVRVTYHPSPLALNQDPARSQQFDEDIAWLGERDLSQGVRASDIKVDRTAFHHRGFTLTASPRRL